MKIISTNIGKKKTLNYKGKVFSTGIYKYPTKQPIFLDIEDVQQDDVVDRIHHGGVDQAVYGYSLQHYGYWKEMYPNLDWHFGMFGENLTIDSLDETTIHVGDRFQVGEAIIEVTKPRQPCYKLGVRFNDNQMVKKFWNSTMSGVYFKIIKTGTVKEGDVFTQITLCSENPTIAQIYRKKRIEKQQ